MKFSFKSLLGLDLREARTTRKVVSAEASVKKEEQQNLSTSDRLKLVRAAREGGANKLTFFELDGQTRGGFRSVCDLYMHLETLLKAMSFCDMGNVFKILPNETIALLEIKLEGCFNSHNLLNDAEDALATDPLNSSLKEKLEETVVSQELAITEIEDVLLEPIDFLTNSKGIEEEEVRTSSRR